MMAYQKCPVCNGVGQVSGGYFTRAGDFNTWTFTHGLVGYVIEICQVCKGKKIIDEVTGLPPVSIEEGKDDRI